MNTINFAENCHAIEFQIPRKGRNREIRGVADAAGVIIEKSRKLWSIFEVIQLSGSTCCLLHFGLIQRRMWSSNNARVATQENTTLLGDAMTHEKKYGLTYCSVLEEA